MFHNLEFDLTLNEVSVTIGSKPYLLREASGEAATRYRNAGLACLELGPEGKPKRITNAASVEVLLVSLCLFEQLGEGKEKAVPAAVIDRWPARVKKGLFDEAKRISDLSEEGPEKQTLEEILSRRDSPVSLATFRKYVEQLPDEDAEYDKDYRPFKTWFKPSAEELAKNEQSDTTDG